MGAEGEGETIVRALVEVCHALSDRVLAEGVESAEQARRLVRLGVDLGQGDCFSPALAVEALERLLADGKPLLPANPVGSS